MRFHATAFVLAALLALGDAQSLDSFPSCSLPCLVAALPSSGCSATDIKCQCTTGQAKIAASVSPCLLSSCSAADQSTFQSAYLQICAPYTGSAASSAVVVSSAKAASSAVAASSALASVIQSAASFASSARVVSSALSAIASATPSNSATAFIASTNTQPSSLRSGSTSSTTSASGDTSVNTGKKSKLSGGAIAGIIIGLLILFALLGAAIVFLLRRRRKENVTPPIADAQMHGEKEVASATQPGTSLPPPSKPFEVESGAANYGPHEMHTVPAAFPAGVPPPYNRNTAAQEMSATPTFSHNVLNSPSHNAPELYTGSTPTHYVENSGPYYPEAYSAPISPDEARASRLAELEMSQRQLEERLARMRQMDAIEEERARVQAEIDALRTQR